MSFQQFKQPEPETNDKPGVRKPSAGRSLRGRKRPSGARQKMLAQFVKRHG